MPPAGGADVVLRTERLVLRGWRRSDREPFASLNADPEVGEFLFPPVLTPEESDGLIERFEAERAAQGYCPWAVAERSTGAFIGFVGLHGLDGLAPSLPFAPGVEVGWRLARRFWGKGYATEAATAALQLGFGELGLEEVVALTAASNRRSRAVMERLGMSRHPRDDFEHPRVPEGHVLRPHVLYRARRS